MGHHSTSQQVKAVFYCCMQGIQSMPTSTGSTMWGTATAAWSAHSATYICAAFCGVSGISGTPVSQTLRSLQLGTAHKAYWQIGDDLVTQLHYVQPLASWKLVLYCTVSCQAQKPQYSTYINFGRPHSPHDAGSDRSWPTLSLTAYTWHPRVP